MAPKYMGEEGRNNGAKGSWHPKGQEHIFQCGIVCPPPYGQGIDLL